MKKLIFKLSTFLLLSPSVLAMDDEAAFQQALRFVEGLSSPDQALQIIRHGAESGNPVAQNGLAAHLLQKKDATPQEIQEGVAWLQKAADGGQMEAVEQLGLAYFTSKYGLPKDKEKALGYFLTAAEAGRECAGTLASLAFQDDTNLSINDPRFKGKLSWVEKALDGKNKDICHWRGFAYLLGRNGSEVDIDKGIKLLEISAEQGNGFSCARLGHTYLTKKEQTLENKKKGFQWLRKGAALENETAMYGLGYCLIAIEGNFEEGVQWIMKAKEKGYEDAIEYMDHLESLLNRLFNDDLTPEERRLVLRKKLQNKRHDRQSSAAGSSTSSKRSKMTHEDIVKKLNKRQEARKRDIEQRREESEKRHAARQRRYANLAAKRQEMAKKDEEATEYGFVEPEIAGPSVTAQMRAQAKSKLALQEGKEHAHKNRSKDKGKERAGMDEPLMDQTELPLSRPQIFIGAGAYKVFEKLWVLKTANETGDETQYTNDRISLTRDEVETLIEALGGHYSTSRGNGSHEMAELSELLDKDRVYLGTESLLLEDVMPEVKKGAVTLPHNEGNRLKPVYVGQLRSLLIRLGYTKETVLLMRTEIEAEMEGSDEPSNGAGSSVNVKPKNAPKKGKGKKKKK